LIDYVYVEQTESDVNRRKILANKSVRRENLQLVIREIDWSQVRIRHSTPKTN